MIKDLCFLFLPKKNLQNGTLPVFKDSEIKNCNLKKKIHIPMRIFRKQWEISKNLSLFESV